MIYRFSHFAQDYFPFLQKELKIDAISKRTETTDVLRDNIMTLRIRSVIIY